MSNLGSAITRADGPIKVTGAARYAGDQNLPGQLYAVFVTATIPAGRMTGVDAEAALAMTGVVRVLVAADMPRTHSDLDKITVPPLATRFVPMQSDEVVYEGQAVAIVLGESIEAAEAGAAAVRVGYARSAFVVPEQAPAVPGDPKKGLYSVFNAAEFKKGDATAAIAAAPVKVATRYTQPSRHANPMEPSAIVAVWAGEQLTVHDGTQHVSGVQNVLAATFGLPATQVRVLSPHTGGGFGVKGFVWPHQLLTALAAKVVRRPVKLVLTRQNMYGMVGPQPQVTHDLSLGTDRSGKLLGITHAVTNVTAVTDDYVEFATLPSRSYYACDNITTSNQVRRGNMPLPSFMRSPWDGPGSWALGSAMDELARALDTDPLDLRLANYAETDPQSGKPWSSKKLREAYEEGAKRFGWRTRSKGGWRDGHWRIGYGMADASQGQARYHSTARIRLRSDGTAQLESSFCDIGTGPATILPQIAAEILGLDPKQVVAISGDSSLPYCGPAFGSATTISTGSAVLVAAQKVRDKLARLAGWPSDEITMKDGRILRGNDARTIQDVLQEAGVSELAADGSLDLPGGAYADSGTVDHPARSFGVIFVEIGVDQDLGLVRLRRATAVYSAGRIINQMTARSQMIGGIVWGWGMATMEASHFEPRLGRWLAKDLAAVPLPVNADIPPDIDIGFIDEFDANIGPLGARGIGEMGATGVAAAVGNAVFDAIGVRIRDLPITPAKIVSA